MKGKKKIRRRPGKKQNLYFTAETQQWIELYQKTEDVDKKTVIYEKNILPAFSKLSENLIFVYGFKSYFATFDELKADCISFLFESIKKWDPSRGTKAFSYFNVVAKNWLIIQSKKTTKNNKRHNTIAAPMKKQEKTTKTSKNN